MFKSLRTTFALALALGSVVTAGGAIASPSPDTYSRTVRVADLDLSSERGAEIALRRIRKAAQYVCGDGPAHSSHVLRTTPSYRSCIRQASGNAVRDLGNPMVTARYSGGKSVQIARK
ncbi:UrcA family protein [Phenylobacterium sp.]|uniref:UrcA family protein n=1 Tax=Phenylobacterium sp. TaxID=1871053 RepID=UPI002ED88C75